MLPEYEHPQNKEESSEIGDFAISIKDFNAAREIVPETKDEKKSNDKKAEKEINAKGDEKEALVKEESVQVLFNVDLQVKHGDLIGVAGAVGSGKSSLIGNFNNFTQFFGEIGKNETGNQF